jgi:hypothetical protein
LEKNMAFSFIPILIAYYLGKYSNIWLRNNWKILPNKFELSKVWVHFLFPRIIFYPWG